MGSPREDCLHARFCRKWWKSLDSGTEMALHERGKANEFFLKELTAEEPSTKHTFKERGFVDVAWDWQHSEGSWFTTLQIVDPGSAPLSWDASSPFKLGYDFYFKCEMEQILVNVEILEQEFLENLPDLKKLFIEIYHEGSEKLQGKPPEDHTRRMILKINALCEGMISETIYNHLSSFLAVFFRILAVKSSELNLAKEITVMDARKEFFLEELNKPGKDARKEFFFKELNKPGKKHTYPMKVFYDLRLQGLVPVMVTKETSFTKPITVLQLDDPYWLFVRKKRCLFQPGYKHYFQDEKFEELEMEFRKHLPVLRFFFVEAIGQHQLPMKWKIYAHFEVDMTLDTIDNLVAHFFAAFFTILEDKSSMSVQTMT